MRPRTSSQTAHHPHQSAVYSIAVENHQAANACTQKCRNSYTCKDDAYRFNTILPSQDVNANCGHHCANKGHRSNQILKSRIKNHNHNACHACTGRNTNQVRISQRIAQNSLQDCTTQSKVDTNQSSYNGAR